VRQSKPLPINGIYIIIIYRITHIRVNRRIKTLCALSVTYKLHNIYTHTHAGITTVSNDIALSLWYYIYIYIVRTVIGYKSRGGADLVQDNIMYRHVITYTRNIRNANTICPRRPETARSQRSARKSLHS